MELKPCPLCGHEAFLVPLPGDWATVQCGNDAGCACEIGSFLEEKAITTWNTRATPKGTVITKDESTWPADERLIVVCNDDPGDVWSEPFMTKWNVLNMEMPELWIGCIWWDTGMFEPPTETEGE